MKSHITKEQVEHIAWLARIRLTREQERLFTEQLNDILEYFREIDEVDTTNVKPTYHVTGSKNVYRDDTPKECLSIEEALMNAPEKEKTFIKGPKII
ncbi:MAG: Asp-tRNA(Asn)/Glu-tRNA(Gln) amidotransferase subunit GatC [Candidatus Hodarchaeota archaeon]